MSEDEASLYRARVHSVRLERRIEALQRGRRTALQASALLLALTWGVGWPVCQWLTARHEAVGRIEPMLVRLEALAAADPLPADYLLIEAKPRLRHAVQVTHSASTSVPFFQSEGPGTGQQHYLPLTVTGRDNEEVRLVIVGLAPSWLDPKQPGALKPPYPVQHLSQGLPAAVRKEMVRRGVRFATEVQLVKYVELSQGHVPNHHVAADALLQTALTAAGSALGAGAALWWCFGAWSLRRLRAQRVPVPVPETKPEPERAEAPG